MFKLSIGDVIVSQKGSMEMECYISLGGTMFYSLSMRKNKSLGKDTLSAWKVTHFLFTVWKVSRFEMANERGENGYVNLCVRYEEIKH